MMPVETTKRIAAATTSSTTVNPDSLRINRFSPTIVPLPMPPLVLGAYRAGFILCRSPSAVSRTPRRPRAGPVGTSLAPNPLICPTHAGAMTLSCRKLSRAAMLERCTSTTGKPIAATASRSAYE